MLVLTQPSVCTRFLRNRSWLRQTSSFLRIVASQVLFPPVLFAMVLCICYDISSTRTAYGTRCCARYSRRLSTLVWYKWERACAVQMGGTEWTFAVPACVTDKGALAFRWYISEGDSFDPARQLAVNLGQRSATYKLRSTALYWPGPGFVLAALVLRRHAIVPGVLWYRSGAGRPKRDFGGGQAVPSHAYNLPGLRYCFFLYRPSPKLRDARY
eukprot:77612-Rhodomonas_salina.1